MAQVGAKDHQLVKGNLDLFSTAYTQKVVSFFQGNNPSVQQFIDTHSLSSEVIDQEDTAVAFDLQWGVANVGFGISGDFQHVHRQFATGDNRWPTNADPSLIDLRISQDAIGGFVGTSSWFSGSKIRISSPSMVTARGIQINSPKDFVTRSAILVFPLPG